MTSSDARLKHIDGLRAIAVLLVVIHHATTHSALYVHEHTLSAWTHLALEGAHGVDLFFVLSGFCLSYPVLARIGRFGTTAFSIQGFAARRILRILPPYYAAIALFILLSFVPAFHESLPSWPDIVRQAEFLDWRTQFLNGSFWTLCVEFRWYFIFPAALALWVYSSRLFFTAAGLLAAAYLTTRLRSIDLGVLLPFVLGIAAAHGYLNPRPYFRYAAVAAPAGVLAGIVLERYLTAPGPYGGEIGLIFMQTNIGWQLAMFFFVVLAGYSTALRQILSCRPLVWIGIASYSIYLIHEPLVQRLDLALPQSLALDWFAAVVMSVGLGFAFWFVAERPWVYGRLRARSLPLLERGVDWMLARLDLPRTFLLHAYAPPLGTRQASDPSTLSLR